MILKILNFIFVTLGIIFFILIIATVLFVIYDPLNLKPLAQSLFEFKNAGINVKDINLQNIKVDCFTNALGEKRTQEIINGSLPSPADILKAKPCLTK